MPICSLPAILARAERENIAVGAFNASSMEIVMGIVAAAEEMNAPVILQVAEKRLRHSPLHLMGPMLVHAAKNSTADIAVQLDHGEHFPVMEKAGEYGFTSVMYDGSGLDLEDNIDSTRKIVQWAHALGMAVEGEIGVIAGSEGGEERRAEHTDPKEAGELADATGCDVLAVAIGNAHGHYRRAPDLDFAVLEKIAARVALPLVLHGGSGISAGDFRKAISLGIRKINIATANMDAEVAGAGAYLASNRQPTYFGMNEHMVEYVKECTKRHIGIFNN